MRRVNHGPRHPQVDGNSGPVSPHRGTSSRAARSAVRVSMLLAWLLRILLALFLAGILPLLCGIAVLAVAWFVVCVVTGGDRWTQESRYPVIITGMVLFGAGCVFGAEKAQRLIDYLLLKRRNTVRAAAGRPTLTSDVEAAARTRFNSGQGLQDTDGIRPVDDDMREDDS